MTSNLTLSKYPGLSLEYFQGCEVLIEGTNSVNLKYSLDDNGYLIIRSYPDLVYDRQSFKQIKISFPASMSAFADLYTFKIIINGMEINYTKSNDSNNKFVQDVIPFTMKMGTAIRDTFTIMNAIGCSYFLISIIGFCNLTLLYYFMHVRFVPSFARMFIFSLLYIFVNRGSMIDSLNKIDWFRNNVNLDFSTSFIIEKMPS